jgi:dTDP-4-amino-4,6-dideoxygalactose transaminase
VWKPLHLQPLYRDAQAVGGVVAERIFEHGLCLPSGTALSLADQERIIATVLSLTCGGH